MADAGNPHYTPEVSTKVMIVNFAVKQQGLEAQLLSTVVKQERADLDRQKNELVVKVAQGKRTQVSCCDNMYLPVFLYASHHIALSISGRSVEIKCALYAALLARQVAWPIINS